MVPISCGSSTLQRDGARRCDLFPQPVGRRRGKGGRVPVCWSAVASEQSFREISFGGACVALGDERAVRGGTRLATPLQQEGCGCEQNLVESVLCLVLPNEQRVVGQDNPSRSPSFPELQERIGLLRAGMDPHQGITPATSSPSHEWSESLRLTGQNDHVPGADSACYRGCGYMLLRSRELISYLQQGALPVNWAPMPIAVVNRLARHVPARGVSSRVWRSIV